MKKYIVTWVLLRLVPTPCPDAPKADEFGRMPSITTSCLVFHARIDSSNMNKEFSDRNEAFAFYNKALLENSTSLSIFRECISNVKIDSIKATK